MKLDLQMFATDVNKKLFEKSTYVGTDNNSTAYILYMIGTEVSYDVATNKSKVNIIGTFKNNTSLTMWTDYGNASCPKFTMSIYDNKTNQTRTYEYLLNALYGNQDLTLFNITLDLEHNSDGKLSISVTYSVARQMEVYYFPHNTTLTSGTKALTTIPRASVLGSVSNYTENTGITIPFTKYASSFYQILYVYIDDTLICRRNGISNNYKLTFSSAELNIIYAHSVNVKEPKLVIMLDTLTSSTGTIVGESNMKTITFTFDNNSSPTFTSFYYEDTNATTKALTGNNQVLINGYSNVKVEITTSQKAVPKKSATMTKYTYQDNKTENFSSTKSVVHTLTKYNYGNTVKVTATDSRGYSTSASIIGIQAITNYTLPIISDINVIRENGVSTTSYLTLRLRMWNGNYNTNRPNQLIYFGYRIKKSSESWNTQTYYDITDKIKTAIGTQSINNIYIRESNKIQVHLNGTSGGIPLSEYDIQLRVSDGYGTTVFNTSYETAPINSGKFLDTYHKTSTGYQYAINRMVDTTLPDGLQFDGQLYQNGKSFFDGQIIITNTNTNPSAIHGGTWTLIDKEFSEFSSSSTDLFTKTDLVSSFTMHTQRIGHNLYMRFIITTAEALTDANDQTLGTINFNALGVTGMVTAQYVMASSDGGNGVVMAVVEADGRLVAKDIIVRGSTGSLPANSNPAFYLVLPFPTNRMLDTACNKFYWRRTG